MFVSSLSLRRHSFILLISSFLLSTAISVQQREYSFNSPGSECYFKYVVFTADSNYSMIRRPFIFMLGNGNESATDVFTGDTLKNSPGFNNYYFVYLPGRDTTGGEKLGCIKALVSLLTYNYKYGKSNLFFQVNDTLVGLNDIDNYGLRAIFKSIRLTGVKKLAVQGFETNDIQNDFKEDAIKYKPGDKVVEDLAHYYVEEKDEEPSGKDSSYIRLQKTYFGPPADFNFTLTGIIRDKGTGEALPFATIRIQGTTNGSSSNADGYFTLLKVPTDTSTLIVQYLGYETQPVFLTPLSPKKNMGIDLKPRSQILNEVKVTAYKDDVVFVKKAEVSTIKLTPLKIEQLPSIGEKDIMRSLHLMPGVSASNESSSGLYVRGGTPDQNLVLYDGFTVYHVDHLYGFFSAFNTNALKDRQLYKGGFESRFGGRISSVTEITSKDGNQKKVNFGFDVSMLSTNMFAEIPIGKKFSSFIAFRKSYQGSIYNLIFKKFNKSPVENAPDIGTGPGRKFSQSNEIASYFYDLNGKFTYKPTDKDVISLSIFNGIDKLDNSFASEIPSFGQFNANFSMNSVDLTKYGNVSSSLKWSRK
jgi:hypothetical protein